MRRVLFKLEAKPEVFELWVFNMHHTGIPNTGWPGFVVFELTIWGNIVTFSVGFCFQLYPRRERLEDIAENLRDQAAWEAAKNPTQDEQSVTK